MHDHVLRCQAACITFAGILIWRFSQLCRPVPLCQPYNGKKTPEQIQLHTDKEEMDHQVRIVKAVVLIKETRKGYGGLSCGTRVINRGRSLKATFKISPLHNSNTPKALFMYLRFDACEESSRDKAPCTGGRIIWLETRQEFSRGHQRRPTSL